MPDRAELDRAELDRDLRRVADRLRTAPLTKLTRTDDHGATGIDRTRAVLAALADLGAGIEHQADPAPPAWREVPDVGVAALGDQVTVLGNDLITALDGVADQDPVWTRTGREPLEVPLAALAEDLRGLRRAL